MKRKATICVLLGAVGLVACLSVANPTSSQKSKEKNDIAVSVVSYDRVNKNVDVNVSTGEAFTATTQAINFYASKNVTSSEQQTTAEKDVKKAAATPTPTATPDPRKEIARIAKIAGKDQPKKLDGSGFIQFVYSKYNKKRVTQLGSTIAIAGLPEIKEEQLKIGDIGLRNGTGSIYFDADGKSYSEPQFAEEANDKKAEEIGRKIDTKKDKRSSLKEKIKNKNEAIEEYQNKILDKKDILDKSTAIDDTEDVSDDTDETVDEDKKEEIEAKREEQKKKAEKIAADLKNYKAKIKQCRKDIKKLSNSVKQCEKDIEKLKTEQKKYKKDIEKSIDHVGIYCGKNKAGKRVWCHCSSSKGGVVYEATDIFTHYYSSESCITK